MNDEIELSIVVASQGSEDGLRDCLRSLDDRRDSRVEIVVVTTSFSADLEGDDTIRVVRSQSPSLPRMLGLGAAAARGNHVALIEACFRFAPGWVDEALRAIRELPSSIVGGCVDPDLALGWIDRAMYFCDYAQFATPWRAGAARELPGSNVIFPREALPSPAELESTGLWKTFLCERLVADGRFDLVAWPSLRAVDARRMGAAAWIARRFRHGRCWGAMTVARQRGSYRFAHAVGLPAIVLVVGWRTWKKLRASRVSVASILAHTIPIMTGIKMWLIGEWVGNLFGAGRSCERL